MESIVEFTENVSNLLNLRKYKEALEILDSKLASISDTDYYWLAPIAGLLIDLGGESSNKNIVEKGLQIIVNNQAMLKDYVTENSFNYCLGNGFQALYKISTEKTKNFYPTPEKIDTLFEAKQYFFKSFKTLDLNNLDNFSIQVLTNLGSNLIHSGRVVESLQLFDSVLQYNPNFFYAQAAKADALLSMIKISQCPLTIALYAEIYRLFNEAEKHHIYFEESKFRIKRGKEYVFNFLSENKFDVSKIPMELELNDIEYNNHPEKLKFFLDNFLGLSEHSLYCKCNGAEKDNLTIGYQGLKTNDKKLIQLELLCDRLKSEFSLAKELLFEYLNSKNEKKENTHYENLIDGILNGITYEKLRTSFRLCFGILDKIAEGICYLYNFSVNKNEAIYFESFWSRKRNNTRWNEINKANNINLTALYSIACDLDKTSGEFGFYKQWRNKLEHGLFSLNSYEYDQNKWEDEKFSLKTNVLSFETETLRLLQLTRSAIFSFVFCVRQELLKKTSLL